MTAERSHRTAWRHGSDWTVLPVGPDPRSAGGACRPTGSVNTRPLLKFAGRTVQPTTTIGDSTVDATPVGEDIAYPVAAPGFVVSSMEVMFLEAGATLAANLVFVLEKNGVL